MQNYSENVYINQEVNPLINHLIARLPKRVCSWNDKEHFHFRGNIPTLVALNGSKWLEYNQGWVNMLIIDIDRPISLEMALNECLEIDFEPTWACKTDKGIHIAYTLENMIKYDWDKAIKLARHIKVKLTELLKADKQGSHKLKGIYRNPLMHEHYYSGLLYSLDDFKKYLLNRDVSPKQQFKKHISKEKRKQKRYKYEIGSRNDYVFRSAMLQSKYKNLSYEDTLSLVRDICRFESMSTGVPQIDDKELIRTARQIKIYNDKDMNFVSSDNVDIRDIDRGAMNFEPICKGEYIEPEEFKRIVKERQKLSAKRTNERKDDMTRSEAAANMRKRKHYQTIGKLETSLNILRMSDTKINISTLAKESGLSRNTVAKYIDNYRDSEGNLR